MAIANVSQTIASQVEYLKGELEMLYLSSSRLWKRIAKSPVKPVSNRPARIPFEVLAGGKFRTFNPDGGDLGQGSGPTEAFGQVSCVWFLQAGQYTAQAAWATDSDEKAIQNYVTLVQKRAMETFAGYMDAAVQGNGSNTLDTVVSTSTGAIVVNNANLFQDNQDVDVWSALGGSLRGTVTIASVDIANNTIWLTGSVPGGTTAGDLCLISGSAAVANSGIFGLRYYQVNGNAGSYMNIQRSTYPGKFSTPYINAAGALTPAKVRALEAQISLAIGIDKANQLDVVAHCNVDMQAAWENNSLPVQSVILNEVKGDESVDMLKRKAPTQIAGRELMTNERAKPGVIDFLALKNWSRIEAKEIGYYDVEGQTLFPAYGASGGLAASMMFYIRYGVQLINVGPRAGAYMDGITIPAGYFGH